MSDHQPMREFVYDCGIHTSLARCNKLLHKDSHDQVTNALSSSAAREEALSSFADVEDARGEAFGWAMVAAE
jgi:hypothetical protein